jgi:hypothetical protein
VQERIARVDDKWCGLHGLGGTSRRSRAHREYDIDWSLRELGGQTRYPVVSAIRKSLFNDEVLAFDIA